MSGLRLCVWSGHSGWAGQLCIDSALYAGLQMAFPDTCIFLSRDAFMALLTSRNGMNICVPTVAVSSTSKTSLRVSKPPSGSGDTSKSPLRVPKPPSGSGDTSKSPLRLPKPPSGSGDTSKSPLRVPKPPSGSDNILDLTDSELSQGLSSDLPQVETSRMTLSSSGSCATTSVVSAIVHPQTPSHSRMCTNKTKTPSRRLAEAPNRSHVENLSEGEASGGSSRDISVSSQGVAGAEPQSSASGGSTATPTSSSNIKGTDKALIRSWLASLNVFLCSLFSVACPVCQVLVFEKFINSHLDKCLNHVTTPTTAHASPQVKRLPKLVFSIMNDKQLRKLLKEYHLPTQGKRDVLLKRIKEFTLLYNAECDALNPRTSKCEPT